MKDVDLFLVNEGTDFSATAFSTHSVGNDDVLEATFLTNIIVLENGGSASASLHAKVFTYIWKVDAGKYDAGAIC